MKKMQCARQKCDYKNISRESIQNIRINIATTKWRNINKGYRFNTNIRSNVVAKEFNHPTDGDAAWFAATSTLEAFKLIITDAATISEGKTKTLNPDK